MRIRHEDGAQVVEGLDAALDAHQQRFLALGEAAGAVVAVVGLEGAAQIGERQAARLERQQVRHHLETAHVARRAH